MWAGMEDLTPDDDAAAAQSAWWDADASSYQEEHAEVLGTEDFVWGPEGMSEEAARILGDPGELAGTRCLEIGAGAAQCSRYLAGLGASVVASDISPGMLASLPEDSPGHPPWEEEMLVRIAADAARLPFAHSVFDIVFTSFGAIPFIEDLHSLYSEVARVLVPGGIFAFSAPHPIRWMFPDSPLRRDMTVTTPYSDRTPYVERDDSGGLVYAEFHHTFADHVNALAAAGFDVERVEEPEWPEGRTTVWGGWGPERSPYIPGTLIVRARLAVV